MWNPPIALSAEEQTIAARTRKARKFFVFLRECRHEILDADFQNTLTKSYSPESGGHEPVEAGLLALATLLQAYCHVGDRDAVELTVMDKRWQMVLDCLGAEHPPSARARCSTSGCGSSPTTWTRPCWIGPWHWQRKRGARCPATARRSGFHPAVRCRSGRGYAEPARPCLAQGRGPAAQVLDTSAEAVAEDAGLTLLGHSSLKAALDLDWGEPSARERALGLVLEEVGRWQCWLEQQHTLATQAPPIKEVMETIAQIITQDTEPDPDGEPGGRRIKKHVAPDRRISIEDKDIRHGRKSSSKTFNGFKEHFAVDLDSKVTREVVVRPANEPEHEVVELLAEELEKAPGLLQLDVDLGYMASPRIAQWAEQGVYIIARPWPQIGPLFTKHDFTLDFARMQVTCPGGQRVPMVPGRHVQFPATACDACALRAQCTKATHGQGRRLSIREDEQFQQKLRAKMKTQRGRASLRKRTAVEHAISHQLAHQGRRARYKGLRKNQFDGRRHAAVSNLQVAAHYAEERRLAS